MTNIEMHELVNRAKLLGIKVVELYKETVYEHCIIDTDDGVAIMYIPDTTISVKPPIPKTKVQKAMYQEAVIQKDAIFNANHVTKIKVIGGKGLTSTSKMFQYQSMNELDLSDMITTNVVDMSYMFEYVSIDKLIIPFTLKNVESIIGMFGYAGINTIDIRNFDLKQSKVKLDSKYTLYNFISKQTRTIICKDKVINDLARRLGIRVIDEF